MAKSRLAKVFGVTPRVLVIDYLLDNTLMDFHKSDIAEKTGISRSTLDNFFYELASDRMIVKSRVIGRAQMYMVNQKNPVVQKLLELDKFLSLKRFVAKPKQRVGG